MTKQQIMEKYASLLRRAWLNPSYKPWQADVHAFEHLHADFLEPLFKKWQIQD